MYKVERRTSGKRKLRVAIPTSGLTHEGFRGLGKNLIQFEKALKMTVIKLYLSK